MSSLLGCGWLSLCRGMRPVLLVFAAEPLSVVGGALPVPRQKTSKARRLQKLRCNYAGGSSCMRKPLQPSGRPQQRVSHGMQCQATSQFCQSLRLTFFILADVTFVALGETLGLPNNLNSSNSFAAACLQHCFDASTSSTRLPCTLQVFFFFRFAHANGQRGVV